MPKLGIDDSRPALARSSPRSVCSVGMRNAAPLMNTFAHNVAVNAITSIDQRRSGADRFDGHAPIVAQLSQHIESGSHIVRRRRLGVAAGGRVAAH